MKKILTLTALALALTAGAQDYSKMSRQLARLARQASVKNTGGDVKSFTGNNERTLIFVKGEEAAVEDCCISHRGDIHIVNIPVSRLAALSEDSRIQRMEANYTLPKASLDKTAETVGAGKVWSGAGLPQAFDGTGVIIGNIDTGHDYAHPTFRSTKDGRQRIVMVYDPLDIPAGQKPDDSSKFPIGTLYTDTAAINAKMHSADYNTNNHGTHTASIASGSGWGSPYRGIAPESDIYMATGIVGNNANMLPAGYSRYTGTAFMALQAENIMRYAEEQNKPCVINYSIGFNEGITKDNTLLDEYLNSITGPGKIMVAAAGNEGADNHGYLPKGTGDTTVGGMLSTHNQTASVSIKTKGTLTLRIRNRTMPDNANQKLEIPLDFTDTGNPTSGSGKLKWDNETVFCKSTVLNGMKVTVYSGLYDGDDSYFAYEIMIEEGTKALESNEYTIEIEGKDTEAEIYVQRAELLPTDENGITLAGAQTGGTINTPASLASTICVGATAWTTSFTNTAGQTLSVSTGKDGERATFSSVGPTMHGLTKPDVMAPGTLVSAADNSFYGQDTSYRETTRTATTTYDGREYNYIVMSGTSMATPVVAGTIALWLQACPTLTKEDIMDIIAVTSRRHDPSLPYPNNHYGHGEIDAYKGLMKILNITNVEGLSTTHLHNATARPAADGSAIIVTLGGDNAAPIACRLYTAAGTLLKTVTIPPHSTTYSIAAEGHKGIIAVQVGNMGSTLVRLR